MNLIILQTHFVESMNQATSLGGVVELIHCVIMPPLLGKLSKIVGKFCRWISIDVQPVATAVFVLKFDSRALGLQVALGENDNLIREYIGLV